MCLLKFLGIYAKRCRDIYKEDNKKVFFTLKDIAGNIDMNF